MARRKTTTRCGTRRGPRDGSGPLGGTKACPVTKKKTTRKKK